MFNIQQPRGAASNGIIPIGGIIMWSGTVATIPANWQLCNGTNGTPDLRDKFIVGATSDDAGAAKTNLTGSLTQSGGSTSYTPGGSVAAPADHAAHTHTGPSHQHNLAGGAATAHNHTYTQVLDHVHIENYTTTTTGNFVGFTTVDTSSGGTNPAPAQNATGLSTANPTGSAGATGTTANNSAGATDNAGTGATGNPSATLTHNAPTFTGNAATIAPPYFALCFIQRLS